MLFTTLVKHKLVIDLFHITICRNYELFSFYVMNLVNMLIISNVRATNISQRS